MRIQDIYDRYTIPPILQKHMYTVASLGSYVADVLSNRSEVDMDIDKDMITQTLLLHDMGNIVKFDLNKPLFIPEEDVDYWKSIQDDFIRKYGADDHIATTRIVEELGVSQNVIELLSATANMTTALAALEKDYNFAIVFYADFRVGPHGILSLDERINDLLVRYKGRHNHFWSVQENAEMMRQIMKEKETALEALAMIPLSTIQNENVEFILKTLSSYPIDLNQES